MDNAQDMTATINKDLVGGEEANKMLLDYLQNRRRQLLGELRDIESHLLNAGRISEPSLRQSRRRN